jgi:hypothetical protein
VSLVGLILRQFERLKKVHDQPIKQMLAVRWREVAYMYFLHSLLISSNISGSFRDLAKAVGLVMDSCMAAIILEFLGLHHYFYHHLAKGKTTATSIKEAATCSS